MNAPEPIDRKRTTLDNTMESLTMPALALVMAITRKCGGEITVDSEDVALVVNKRIQYGCVRGTITLKVVDE